ncbi:PREDICTED: histone-lysine N-methyltransferase SETMAR-like [Atta cephalotes]|uniref:Mos1 transposase HTH domain-containing protein n=1 Tax=Atta cephalotes TaxID=12957 RepID=A0A158NUI5_ATTCE|nr:PREDICTED: histone-lysine N-methyltransferase SETMAR-like [Atta cephalotes]
MYFAKDSNASYETKKDCRTCKNATQATNKICAVYGEDAVGKRIMRKWFARFKTGDFNLEDQECPGRPSTTDEDQIKRLIENNLRYTTRKLAEMLNMSKSTIHKYFVKLGYINRFDVWIPHDLTKKNLMDHIFICDSINAREDIIFEWDWKGILYYELLPNNEINSEEYCSQLDELKTAIEKRPEIANRKIVVFHQNNARPCVFDNPTKVVEARLGCSTPYSDL